MPDTPSPPTPAIDREHLDRLTARWGATFTCRMIDLFLDQSTAKATGVSDGWQGGDIAAVGAAAHALKSSAGNIGARLLMDSARIVEEAAAGADRDTLAIHVPELVRRAADARDALRPIRAELAG